MALPCRPPAASVHSVGPKSGSSGDERISRPPEPPVNHRISPARYQAHRFQRQGAAWHKIIFIHIRSSLLRRIRKYRDFPVQILSFLGIRFNRKFLNAAAVRIVRQIRQQIENLFIRSASLAGDIQEPPAAVSNRSARPRVSCIRLDIRPTFFNWLVNAS